MFYKIREIELRIICLIGFWSNQLNYKNKYKSTWLLLFLELTWQVWLSLGEALKISKRVGIGQGVCLRGAYNKLVYKALNLKSTT